jgi:hypothetical protein
MPALDRRRVDTMVDRDAAVAALERGKGVIDGPTRLVVETPDWQPPYNALRRFYDEADRSVVVDVLGARAVGARKKSRVLPAAKRPNGRPRAPQRRRWADATGEGPEARSNTVQRFKSVTRKGAGARHTGAPRRRGDPTAPASFLDG